MNNRITAILTISLLALPCIGVAAHAEGSESERCLDAAAQGDAQKTVAECTRAVEADPQNERARTALDDAKAELARVDSMKDPAKLNQY